MRRLLFVAAIAACTKPTTKPVQPTNGSNVTTTHEPPPDAAVPIITTTQPSTNATLKKFPPRAMIEAPHAGPIKMVAATVDGSAAISVDDIDGIRLWPKLDGTTEPRVVDLVRPKQLALGKLADGSFLAVVIDDVGGLVIATLDPDGHTKQRATIGPEPAYSGAIVVGENVLAWRSDRSSC